MDYSPPTQALVDEHAVIVSVIEAVEIMAQRPASAAFPQEFFEQACDFFTTFADRCHHGKEEARLFPMMTNRGFASDGGPIGCMLAEHDEGRGHIAAMRAGLERTAQGDQDAADSVRAAAREYSALLRQHIMKENEVLFVMADRLLSAADKQQLMQQFQDAEQQLHEPGTHERYVALAQTLRAAAGLDPRAAGAGCTSCCGHAH